VKPKTTHQKPVEVYYDAIAHIYDHATAPEGAWTAPEEARKAMSSLPTPESALIIGIGSGQDIDGLKKKGCSHIEGIDISREMIAACHGKHPDVLLHHGDVVQYDVFYRSRYDLIVCSGTSEFIKDIDAFFALTSRLLGRHGFMILTFEPIIPGHDLQFEAQSSTPAGPSFPSITTYRRNLDDILSLAAEVGMTPSHADPKSYVAYRKAGVDVIYQLVVFEKTADGSAKNEHHKDSK